MLKARSHQHRAGASRRRFVSIVSITMPLAFGCKGCEDAPRPPAPAAQTITHPTQGDEAKRNRRLNGRHLDRSKQYPKNAEGGVACGGDVDCFVLQAESCTPADLDNTLRGSAFGVVQAITAHYHIRGGDGDHCEMTRHISEIGVQLDPKLEGALRNRGKNDDDIAAMRSDNERALRRHNPEQVACTFARDEALSVALDIAESKPDPRLWQKSCKETLGAGAPAVAPAQPADKAAPSKPAENR